MIHPTAEVEDGARIGATTRVWHQAHVRSGAVIGEGCNLGMGVYVDSGVIIGDNVKLQNRVSVYRGVTIEDGVFVGPHATFTNDRYPRAVSPEGEPLSDGDWTPLQTLVRYGASIGASAVVLAGLSIGRWAMIGAGAVVAHDVPDHGLVTGNPAQLVGYVCSCGRRLAQDGLVWRCRRLRPEPRAACPGAGPMIRIAQPDIGAEEIEAVRAVLESGRLAAGPLTRELEERFAKEVSHTREAVAVANGTAALHVALLAHDIGPGDEVITTPFTFQATANMILAVGARPVFVDVGEDANIDASLIEAAITPRTRAILPVHLFGRICDMTAIGDIARRHSLVVIEDAAQAHCASLGEQRAGSFGTGCFSLYATKNLMAGEGGMIGTDDSALANRMRRIRSHGESERYNTPRLGFNYRMTDIAAAIGLAQLDKLPAYTEARRRNAAYFTHHLRGVGLPPDCDAEACVWNLYTIRVAEGRDELAAALRDAGIESGIYYPKTLPEQKLYADLGYGDEELPKARRLTHEVLSLPVHPGLSESDREHIVATVNAWAESRTMARK